MASTTHTAGRYYLPEPSKWPITASIAMLFVGFGAALTVNHLTLGYVLLGIGLVIFAFMLFGWFGTVAHESEGGRFNQQVDTSFRWGMSWFIFSEVMFFGAFFGALFYARVLAVPWLGGAGTGMGAASAAVVQRSRRTEIRSERGNRMGNMGSQNPCRWRARSQESALRKRSF